MKQKAKSKKQEAGSNKQPAGLVLTESVGEAASRKNKQILRYSFFLTAKTAKDTQRSAEGAQLIKFWATLITNKQQRRTKENVTRIIFRQSQGLWAFDHSRKIRAVAVAKNNTKPHLPPMDCPG